MKECREIRNYLPDFLSDRVSPEDRRVIEEHLALCRSCQAEAAEQTRAFIALKQSEAPLPPEAYWQNFLPRLHERLEKRKARGLGYEIGQESRPWIYKVLIPSVALVATIFILTRIDFVPESQPVSFFGETRPRPAIRDGQSISELRQIVQEMNVSEMQEATATSPTVLIPEPVSRVEAVLTHDEETSQVLSSLIAVSSDELDRFQQATLSGSTGTGLEDLNDEEVETVIMRLQGAGAQ